MGDREILGSHLNFGDPRRGGHFPLARPGPGQFRGDRACPESGYDGTSRSSGKIAEWDREYGAAQAARFVKERMGFKSAGRLFDTAFREGRVK